MDQRLVNMVRKRTFLPKHFKSLPAPVRELVSSSRKKGLMGLVINGTFKVMNCSEVPDVFRIFGSRFVNELKRACLGVLCKSLLISQN